MIYAHQASHPSKTQPIMSDLKIPGLQILNVIGQGGMATVYLALQKSLQRPVAVKILNHTDNQGFHERFINEGRYIAAMSHSNIVEVYDVGERNGLYHIVMEYLPGGDLKQKIRKGIRPGTAMKLLARLANCLDYLHGQGIVHRDMKPSNILFREDGNPVITDFGIAKLLQDHGDMTLDGSIMGSPYYLSPEQADSTLEVDGRSDLYSLGVILFEMLTGRRPFTGDNFAAVVMAHRESPIPRLPANLAQYQAILDQLLAKDPQDRFQNGQELIQAIRASSKADIHPISDANEARADASAVSELEETRAIRSARPGLKWPLLMSAIVGLAGMGIWFYQNMSEPPVKEPTVMMKVPVPAPPSKPLPSVAAVAPIETPAVKKQPRPVVKPAKVRAKRTPPVKSRMSQADRLFRLAYARMDTLRLSYPKGDNALHYFQQILHLEPDNKAAKAGIRQIVRWYGQKAEQALQDGEIKKGQSYVERGLAISPRNHQLRDVQKKLRHNRYGLREVFDLSSVFE